MKQIFSLAILSVAFCSISFCDDKPKQVPASQSAQTKVAMISIYDSYKELLPYLNNLETFLNPTHREKIYNLIVAIEKDFHTTEGLTGGYKSQPGFETNVRIVKDLLRQVRQDGVKGFNDYDFFRLNAINRNCISCHAAYNPKLTFYDDEKVTGLDEKSKTEFYLATRQLDKAEASLYKAVTEERNSTAILPILRRWILIETRVNEDPKLTIAKIEEIKKSNTNLSLNELEELDRWITGLKGRAADSGKVSGLEKAKSILRPLLRSSEPLYKNIATIDLIYATGILQRGLADSRTSNDDRRVALYLLGLAYSKLPQFFIDELPEVYLEQCIRNYPQTKEAQGAYETLKEVLTNGYTGSGGTNMPADITAKLQDLKQVAYGVPKVEDRL